MRNYITKFSVISASIILSFLSTARAVEDISECSIAGSDKATVVIQEFVDFECKYCVRGANTIYEIVKSYPGQVKLVMRTLPLSFHEHALDAAKAFKAICLQSTSLAYSYQKELFNNQDKLSTEGAAFLFEVAEKIGVNIDKMRSDINSEAVANSLAKDKQIAQDNNFKGVPSFLIGSERVVGALSYDEIKEVVDRQLKSKK